MLVLGQLSTRKLHFSLWLTNKHISGGQLQVVELGEGFVIYGANPSSLNVDAIENTWHVISYLAVYDSIRLLHKVDY